MKRVFSLTLAAIAALLLSFNAKAQDINEAIDLFNTAKQNFETKQYDQALTDANKVYDMLQTIGDAEGEEFNLVKANTEQLLLAIPYTQGKELLTAKSYDEATVKLKEAKAAAERFNNAGVTEELTKLIPQISIAKATELLAAEDFQGAISAYQVAATENPNEPDVFVRLAYAYNKLGDEANATTYYEKAIQVATAENDEKNLEMAKGQLATIYLKQANASQQAKKWADVSMYALKSLEYKESPQAYLMAGSANFNLKKYDAAITNLEKAASLETNDQRLQNIAYQLAVSYDTKNNKAKACENYKKIVNNQKFKAYAESRIKALGC